MAFIRKHMRKGRAYFSVVETFRENDKVRQKILHYIGSSVDYALFLKNASQTDSFLTPDLQNLSYQTPVTLWKLMEQAEIQTVMKTHFSKKWGVDAATAAGVMILNYATDRHTKNTLHEWYEQTWLQHLLKIPPQKMNKDLLCRTMDFFTEQKIEQIHAEIFKKVREKFQLSDNYLFYDITDITFEGNECPLAKHGYNSRHAYQPQINLAMPVTVERFPVSHKVFEGSTKDSKTLDASIALVEKTGIMQKTVFIFDRGICSKANFDAIESKGAQFICGYTKNSKVKTRIAALKPEQFIKIDDDISFHETTEEGRRLLFFWSKKLQNEGADFRQKRIKKIEEKLSKLAKTADRYELPRLHERIGAICGSYRKFFDIKTAPFSFSIKQEILDKAITVEGKYAILTNTALEPEEVLIHYRDRNFIEMSFKDLKMFVDVRPVRHWKEQRVLAHIFLAVLAFGLRSLLQLKLQRAGLKLSAEEAIRQMNSVRALSVSGKILRLTGETAEARKIVAAIETVC